MTLSTKIWQTRKTRINSEQRLKTCQTISEMLMIWYSFVLVSLAVWNLLKHDQIIELSVIFGSIGVMAVSIFLSAQKYTERALAMRNFYIRLDQIYQLLLIAENNKNKKLISQLEKEYFDQLQNIENHTEYDYLRFRFNLRNDKNSSLPVFTKMDWIVYVWESFWRFSLSFLLFILPLLVGIIIHHWIQ